MLAGSGVIATVGGVAAGVGASSKHSVLGLQPSTLESVGLVLGAVGVLGVIATLIHFFLEVFSRHDHEHAELIRQLRHRVSTDVSSGRKVRLGNDAATFASHHVRINRQVRRWNAAHERADRRLARFRGALELVADSAYIEPPQFNRGPIIDLIAGWLIWRADSGQLRDPSLQFQWFDATSTGPGPHGLILNGLPAGSIAIANPDPNDPTAMSLDDAVIRLAALFCYMNMQQVTEELTARNDGWRSLQPRLVNALIKLERKHVRGSCRECRPIRSLLLPWRRVAGRYAS
jgi:hypothetical protein